MSPAPASFDVYVASLSQLDKSFDPTIPTAETEEIRALAAHVTSLPKVDRDVLAALIQDQPDAVPILGLAVGLTRERLKNVLKHHLDSAGWITLARGRPADVIAMLDTEYDVVRLVDERRNKAYDFGDAARTRLCSPARRAVYGGPPSTRPGIGCSRRPACALT